MKKYTDHEDMNGARIYDGDFVIYSKGSDEPCKVVWGTANTYWAIDGLKTWVVAGKNGLRWYLIDSKDNLLKIKRLKQ